jgi:hypothetical protein
MFFEGKHGEYRREAVGLAAAAARSRKKHRAHGTRGIPEQRFAHLAR